jgi:hypothetical protein
MRISDSSFQPGKSKRKKRQRKNIASEKKEKDLLRSIPPPSIFKETRAIMAIAVQVFGSMVPWVAIKVGTESTTNRGVLSIILSNSKH